MKRLISILAILAAGVAGAMAQQAVAVLTHDGTSKTYQGYTALQDAYAASASGDLITLSSGTFASIATIEKALTIRGAGMEYDSIYHTQATILQGDFTLALPETETGRFQLEGIYHDNTLYYKYNLQNPQFVKCRFAGITDTNYEKLGTTYTSTMKNANFFHCKIVSYIDCSDNSSISAVNCYIRRPYTETDNTSSFYLENCLVFNNYISSWSLKSSTLINCIIVETANNSYFGYNNNTTFISCLLPGRYKPETSKNSYQNYDKIQVVFDTYTGTYTDAEDFTMRDEMKVLYCDENGSELGMYGGSFPYSPRVAGPHLSLFNVAPHSTSDGKLRVRLQVESTLE